MDTQTSSDASRRPIVVAHLSDPHLDARLAPIARFRQVLAAVRAMPRLDALVVSGDIANNGLAAEYDAFRAELPEGVPTIVTLGNHDSRAGFEQVVGPRNSLIDVEGVRIVGLDSSIPGRDEGRLDEETIAFAHRAIVSAPGSVLLALHHPPVPIGHSLIDATALINIGDLADLVATSPAVIGLLTGHVHTPHVAAFGRVPVTGAPGIVSTLCIDAQERIDADGGAPPGFVVHRVHGGRLSTRFVALTPL